MTTVDPNAAATGSAATGSAATGSAVAAGSVATSAVDLDVSSERGRTYRDDALRLGRLYGLDRVAGIDRPLERIG